MTQTQIQLRGTTVIWNIKTIGWRISPSYVQCGSLLWSTGLLPVTNEQQGSWLGKRATNSSARQVYSISVQYNLPLVLRSRIFPSFVRICWCLLPIGWNFKISFPGEEIERYFLFRFIFSVIWNLCVVVSAITVIYIIIIIIIIIFIFMDYVISLPVEYFDTEILHI